MRLRIAAFAIVLCVAFSAAASAEETIVFFRHGEKPSAGLGQLTCQGMNRALALPGVLLSRFETPKWLYAPNPGFKISDPGGSFNYVRPLATIEPVAVKVGLSINTGYNYNDVAGLEGVLIRSTKANDTIFVSWEHEYLVKIVQDLLNKYGGGFKVPAWATGDYDSLYILHLLYTSTGMTARFELGTEGLNGQPTSCNF
jgi:hypothetical protein